MEDLDRWIAENIMEFEYIDQLNSWYPTEEQLGRARQVDDGHPKSRWHPPTDIAQAFQVVGKMVKNGWKFEMHIQGEDQWACFSKCPDPFHPKIFCSDDKEIATAICLAAKKALEE